MAKLPRRVSKDEMRANLAETRAHDAWLKRQCAEARARARVAGAPAKRAQHQPVTGDEAQRWEARCFWCGAPIREDCVRMTGATGQMFYIHRECVENTHG